MGVHGYGVIERFEFFILLGFSFGFTWEETMETKGNVLSWYGRERLKGGG